MNSDSRSPVYFLLVDDLEENLLALEGLLRRDRLIVLKARTGAEALEYLLKYDIALAFLDVQMPGMDGFELAELMRGTERTRRVPIIFLTAGSADQQRRFRGYEAGAVDFLTKPIDAHMLRSKADVFFELWLERNEVARQRDELRAATDENARLLEETRQKAQALREADRRKDEFLATLAHELRNPLAPLGNGLQLMRVAANDAEAIAKAREMMERQLTHMVRLVDDLLDISRVTTGKVRLKVQRIDLRIAIESAIESTRPAIEAGGHSLIVSMPDRALWLEADPTRISQVVGNLLTNAGKYTPAGGRIEVSVVPKGNRVSISVSDTGIGIPVEMLPKVFDLFIQVGQGIERSQGGLGIGLSLVKKLVELHGGSVVAESEGNGRGSTFTVELPLLEAQTAPHAAERSIAPVSQTQPRRILVVDDHVDGAETLAMLLAYEGHMTQVAHSGPEALSTAALFLPEVVFLDIGLPGMNGFEVAKTLRMDERFRRAILVALTGWGSDSDRRQSKEAGFDFHLTKPVEGAQIEKLFSEISSRG